MEKPSKEQLVVVCGSGFIVVGIAIILVWAYNPLWEANQWVQNPTCKDLLICKPVPIFFEGRNPNGNLEATISGEAVFSSRGVFAIDSPIYYEIKLKTDKPEFVQEIYFVIAVKGENYTKVMNEDVNFFFQKMKHDQKLIDMQKISNTEFYRKGLWTINLPVDQVFTVLIVDSDKRVHLIDTTDILFTMASPEVKAQDSGNIESRLTNKVILGLTWMGIGLAPILLGADFIVRVILKND